MIKCSKRFIFTNFVNSVDQTFILLSFHTEAPWQTYFSLQTFGSLGATLFSSGERDEGGGEKKKKFPSPSTLISFTSWEQYGERSAESPYAKMISSLQAILVV